MSPVEVAAYSAISTRGQSWIFGDGADVATAEASMVVMHGGSQIYGQGFDEVSSFGIVVGWLIRRGVLFGNAAVAGLLSTSFVLCLCSCGIVVGLWACPIGNFWRHRRRWRCGLELTMSPREKVLWCY